jgi:hypothetical protein
MFLSVDILVLNIQVYTFEGFFWNKVQYRIAEEGILRRKKLIMFCCKKSKITKKYGKLG